jgi:hypothetical protein
MQIEKMAATYGSMTLPESGSTYKQELEQVIDLFRKIREAVFATKWSNNDLDFSIEGAYIYPGLPIKTHSFF